MKHEPNDGHGRSDGVDAKCRKLKAEIMRGVERCDRSLVFGVTIPDPKSEGTPDARMQGPRGVRLMREDSGMAWCDYALMVGYCYAQLDALTEYFIARFEDQDVIDAVGMARRLYGDEQGMKAVPREWSADTQGDGDRGDMQNKPQNLH